MKKILLLSITSLAMLMADITLEGGQLTPLTEPVAETTPTVTEPTAPTGEYTIVPGLYGFGTDTRAAYGGAVDPIILHVDTLAAGISNTDSTHGSFEWAVTQTFPRVVVFDVGGKINGKSDYLVINNPYMTIAGHTAPAQLVYHGYGLMIKAPNIVIQHLAIRGGSSALEHDGISIVSDAREVYNVVIDHVSSTWHQDEQISISQVTNPCHDITIANSIIGESISQGAGDNAYGSLNYGENISHIRNLYIHNYARNPQVGYTCKMGVFNSIVYNAKHSNVLMANQGNEELTYIGNETIAGLDSWGGDAAYLIRIVAGSKTIGINMSDNIKRGTAISGYEVLDSSGNGYTQISPLIPSNFTPIAASETKASVLANAGARPGERDTTDTRLINDVINGTGNIIGPVPSLPAYSTVSQAFVPVANPHDMYNEHYTNLENQLHQLAEAVETSK